MALTRFMLITATEHAGGWARGRRLFEAVTTSDSLVKATNNITVTSLLWVSWWFLWHQHQNLTTGSSECANYIFLPGYLQNSGLRCAVSMTETPLLVLACIDSRYRYTQSKWIFVNTNTRLLRLSQKKKDERWFEKCFCRDRRISLLRI